MKKISSLIVTSKVKVMTKLSLVIYYLVFFANDIALADARETAKKTLQDEGKNIFVAVSDVTKYLAPFITVVGILFIFVEGLMDSDDNNQLKIKKKMRWVLSLGFGVTVVSWIVSLVMNKTI